MLRAVPGSGFLPLRKFSAPRRDTAVRVQHLSGCDFREAVHLQSLWLPPALSLALCCGAMNRPVPEDSRLQKWRTTGQPLWLMSGQAQIPGWTGGTENVTRGLPEVTSLQAMPAFPFPAACVGRSPEAGREHAPLQSRAACHAPKDGALCREPRAPG